MNAEYIKAMDETQFTRAAMPYYKELLGEGEINTGMLFRILQPRLDLFSEIPEKIAFLAELPGYDVALFSHKKMKTNPELALEIIKWVYDAFSGMEWSEQAIHGVVVDLAKEKEMKNGQFFWSVRIALTGTQVTPGGAVEAAVLLGKEESLRRMRAAIEKLENRTD
jgi:glutamyl-tRNA synthetase